MKQLMQRAAELAETGSVMMIELVQVVEDFLVVHNRDPNMSAWEQMKAREAEEKERERKADEEMNRLMDTSANRIASPTSSKTAASFLDGGGWNVAPPALDQAASSEVEKELLRQRDALDAASRQRKGSVKFQLEALCDLASSLQYYKLRPRQEIVRRLFFRPE